MRDPIIRWGILGPGKIAGRLAEVFSLVPYASLHAAGSRDLVRSRAFTGKFFIPNAYGSYDELVNDPVVDIIYVATPHNFHYEHTLLALNGGKAVLCEKPLSLNMRQAQEMFDVAQRRNIFLMEAMWSRFFPALNKAEEIIRQGTIGDVRFMTSDFGFSAPFNPSGRVFNPALGGGSWLDVGVYPLFLTSWLLGKPAQIAAQATLSSTGADETTSALFKYKAGAIAHLLSSVVADSPKEAVIMGTQGRVTLASPWHKSEKTTLRLNSGVEQVYDYPHKGNGFEYQVQHVTECLLSGLKKSPLMTPELSLLIAEVSDEVRMQCGIRYREDLGFRI